MDASSLVTALRFHASDWALRGQSLHFIVGSVCLTGVLLAYFSDEEYTRQHAKSVVGDAYVKNNTSVSKTDGQGSSDFLHHSSVVVNLLSLITSAFNAAVKGDVWERLNKKMSESWELFKFTLEARSLKQIAQTRRQFFYMMEKLLLGIPVNKGETEVRSYLDVKRALGSQFPFMWEVSGVKGATINCDGYSCIPVSSYSYLDLLRSEEVQEYAIKCARDYSSGNHGPRMLGGNTTILCQLENVISTFFGREGTLLTATGYTACLSAVVAVAQKGDVIFADARAHASLRAGIVLSGAKSFNFKHNDFTHAEKIIRKNRHKYRSAWMVIESVYSMDGDMADLPAAAYVAEKYDVKIILDEAHGLGVLGRTGRGLEEHHDMPGVATIICGTFSKSIASIGGYISGPKDWIDYMDFHAPASVFSAPLPAYCAGAALKAFELIDRESWRVLKAQDNSLYLRAALTSGLGLWPHEYPECDKYEVEGEPYTTVLPVVFADDLDRLIRIATTLKKRGFMASAVAFPACPLRRPRLRITATASLTRPVMDDFVTTLVKVCVDEPPSEIRRKLQALSIM